jgi:hypothetical protein
MLAIAPICALVFMTMLASQPTSAPMISVTIQFMCGSSGPRGHPARPDGQRGYRASLPTI